MSSYDRLHVEETPEVIAAGLFTDIGVSPDFLRDIPVDEARIVLETFGKALGRAFHPDHYHGDFNKFGSQNYAIDQLQKLDDETLATAIALAADKSPDSRMRQELRAAEQTRQLLLDQEERLTTQSVEALITFESGVTAANGIARFVAGARYEAGDTMSVMSPVTLMDFQDGRVTDIAVVKPVGRLYGNRKNVNAEKAEQLEQIRQPGTVEQSIVITPTGQVLREQRNGDEFEDTDITVDPELFYPGFYHFKDVPNKGDRNRTEPAYISYAVDEVEKIFSNPQTANGARLLGHMDEGQLDMTKNVNQKLINEGDIADNTLASLSIGSLRQLLVSGGLQLVEPPALALPKSIHLVSGKTGQNGRLKQLFLHPFLTHFAKYDKM